MSQSKNKTPILLLYTHECEAVERIFTNLANKKSISTQIVNITAPEDEPRIRSILQKSITSVSCSYTFCLIDDFVGQIYLLQ